MSASEAQIVANRANSLKSCGPRSEAGKLRSRRNALRHGMAGQGVVMLPEDEVKLRDREETWGDSFRPETEVEDYLVGLAVHHSVKLDRCMAVESTAARDSADRAVRDFGPTRYARIAAVESEIRQWDRVAETLATAGTLYRDDLDRLRALLAVGRPSDVPEPSDIVTLAREAATGPKPSALPSARSPSAQAPQTPPTAPSPWTQGPARVPADRALGARRVLAELIAGGRADRVRERDRLIEELRSPEALAIARTLASFDIGPVATLARRYETSGELGLYRALKHLEQVRKRRAQNDGEPESIGVEQVASNAESIEPRGLDSLANPRQVGVESPSVDNLDGPGNLGGFPNEANPVDHVEEPGEPGKLGGFPNEANPAEFDTDSVQELEGPGKLGGFRNEANRSALVEDRGPLGELEADGPASAEFAELVEEAFSASAPKSSRLLIEARPR